LRPHEAQLEDQKQTRKSQQGHLEEEKTARATKGEKVANQGKEQRKAQN
jgi:hypothetical protein